MTMPRNNPVPDRPRKSPLRVAAGSLQYAAIGRPPAEMTGEQLRAMTISEFCLWLRSRTNKEKRPFQDETITAYKVAARALDAWMTSAGFEGLHRVRHRGPEPVLPRLPRRVEEPGDA